MWDGGERLHTWMAGNATDSEAAFPLPMSFTVIGGRYRDG